MITKFKDFLKEAINIPVADPMVLNCPACDSLLDTDYYRTIPQPRKCVGCGEDIEEILGRKSWNWT